MSNVPVGVISADAIEQLDPYVPLGIPADQPKTGRGSRRPSESSPSTSDVAVDSIDPQWPDPALPARSSFAQLALTTLPLIAIDLAALSLSIALGTLLVGLFGVTPHSGLALQGIVILTCHLMIGLVIGLFPATAVSPVLELRQLVRSIALSFGLVILLNRTVATLHLSELLLGATSLAIAVVLVPLVRALGRSQLGKFDWFGERALIIGSGAQGRAIFDFYRRSPGRGLRPVGLVSLDAMDIPTQFDPAVPTLGSIADISRLTERDDIRWGIVAPAGTGVLSMNEVMKFTTDLRHLIVLPSQFLLPSLWTGARECAGVLGVHVTDHLHRPGARAVKTAVDLTVALVALIVASPLILLFVAIIKWVSPGPAFYGHTRIGRGGQKFRAWKLRTMVTNADEVLEKHLEDNFEARQQWMQDQKLRSDPRIIPVIGHLLRKTSLDELPQLINVLTGEMSLVGPRPIVTSEIERYGEMYPLYLRVTPGITGLWQVSGRNDTSYSQRVRLDCYYVCNWSVWLDFYIAIRTVRTLLMREGAY